MLNRNLFLFLSIWFLLRSFESYCFYKKPDEYEKILNKWKEVLIGSNKINIKDPQIQLRLESIAVEAEREWKSMDKMLWRIYLWKDLTSNTVSSQLTSNYQRLRALALAYATPGCRLEKNKKLRDDIIFALEWMYKNKYNEKTKPYDNWWHWEIGAPLHLNDIITLMHEDLSKEQRIKYCKTILHFSPNTLTIHYRTSIATAANKTWKSMVLILTGAIIKDYHKIDSVQLSISDVFDYVQLGDGFYKDGSFIQHHKHPYNGGYGISQLSDLSNVLYLLNKSPWEIKSPKKNNIYSWIHESFIPLSHNSIMMDMVRGREISRNLETSGKNSWIAACIKCSLFAPLTEANKLKEIVKAQLVNPEVDFYSNASLFLINHAKEIIQNKNIKASKDRSFTAIFPKMDRAVIKRPGYTFGISMFSSRIFNYESINNENLRGWNTSYGMTYLYNDEAEAYSNFWPSVNPYRLAGTTISTIKKLPAALQSHTNDRSWVGGVTLDSLNGAVGMELKDVGSSLQAKKSWFIFDNEIVALGTDIKAEEDFNIESIIENRQADTTNLVLTINGKELQNKNINVSKDVEWIHLKTNNSTIGTGYFFPVFSDLHLEVENRMVAWEDINKLTPPNVPPKSQGYGTLWLDHGKRPKSANYQYVILPMQTSEETETYNRVPDISIIQNDPNVQAAKETISNVTAANFWKDEITRLSVDAHLVIICDKKASIILKDNDEDLEIAISDPTQSNEASIDIEILNRSATDIISKDDAIGVILNESSIKLTINTKGANGRSIKAKLKTAHVEQKNR